MYTTKISSQGTISIPAPLRKKYNLKAGETVTITDNGQITVLKNKDFATLRAENAKYIKGILPSYKNGDGWTAHVLEKYGK